MAIYAIGERTPEIHESAFVHPDATVIGSVILGPNSSVWPQAVIRADHGTIRIGARSNVQDGAILHVTPEHATVVGEEVVIGHQAHLEGCTIEDRALVGVGSAVLHQAVVGHGATVGAGAVVTNKMVVPAGALAVGVPATIKPDRSRADMIGLMAASYVKTGAEYRTALRRLD